MSADYKVHGDVAVISLNNPPVNGLGFQPVKLLRMGLKKQFKMLLSKPLLLQDMEKLFQVVLTSVSLVLLKPHKNPIY